MKKEAVRQVVIPDEPEQGDPSAVKLVMRMPSGERVERRFTKEDTVKVLYDFVDSLQLSGKCSFESGFTQEYKLICVRPRAEYEDKEKTLEESGLYPRGAILQVQQIE